MGADPRDLEWIATVSHSLRCSEEGSRQSLRLDNEQHEDLAAFLSLYQKLVEEADLREDGKLGHEQRPCNRLSSAGVFHRIDDHSGMGISRNQSH